MTHRHTIASIVLGAISAYAAAATPSWLEADSAAAIESRIRSDFSLTYKEGSREIKRRHPGVTDADIRDFARRGYPAHFHIASAGKIAYVGDRKSVV